MIASVDLYVKAALWSQVMASGAFVAVLVWLWVKYLQPAILAAQERQNKQIALTERHRDEAKATLDLLRNEIDGAAHDARLIAERAKTQSVRETQAILAEAREAGERAVAGARGEYDRALSAARARLRQELLAKALDRARQRAADRVDATVDAKLVGAFVTSLKAPAAVPETAGNG
jgi:F0F1-type ATP synthase membrane subunit b/b'